MKKLHFQNRKALANQQYRLSIKPITCIMTKKVIRRKKMSVCFNNWTDQQARMERWYTEFKTFNDGFIHENPDYYHCLDVVYAFFQNCYHLKDWLKNDKKVTIPNEVIEEFINHNDCLRICADICNASKHFEVTSKRYDKNTKLDPTTYTIAITEKGRINKMVYNVYTGNGGKIDAFQLATNCLKAWEKFIGDNKARLFSKQ
jgi:hypothetical protein